MIKHKVDICEFSFLVYLSTLFLLYDSLRPIVEIIAIFGFILSRPEKTIDINMYVVRGVLFILICLLSSIWSDDKNSSVYATRGVVECFICSMMVQMYLEDADCFDTIVKWCTVLCYLLMIKILITTPISGILGRQYTEHMNANSIGIRFAISFVLFLWLLKKRTTFTMIDIIVLLPIGFFSILSGSKKAIIILAMGVILMGLLYTDSTISKTMFLITGILVLTGVYLFVLRNELLYSIIGKRIDGMVKGLRYGIEYADASTRERMYLIKYAEERWFERPIFGHGINSFANTVGYMGYGDHNLYTHNNYLELLYGVGLFGTIIYYILPCTNLIVCFKQEDRNMFTLGFCTALIVLFIDGAMVSYGDEFVQFILMISYCAATFSQYTMGDGNEIHSV